MRAAEQPSASSSRRSSSRPAPRGCETGEANAKKCKRRGFGHRCWRRRAKCFVVEANQRDTAVRILALATGYDVVEEEIHEIARVDVHHVSVKTRLRAAIEIELHNTVVIDQEHIVVDIIRER